MSLDWPEAFERTPESDRRSYPHGFQQSRRAAFDSILDELDKMDGVRNLQVKTAAPHTANNPHQPYKDRDPDDPGVVVYFERDGQQFAVPCDRWDNLRDNARAIALYLDAKRALDRYGVETVRSEFDTQALPEPDDAVAADPPPHEVLDVAPDAPEAIVQGAFRAKVNEVHPDKGGSQEAFERVQRAREALLDDT